MDPSYELQRVEELLRARLRRAKMPLRRASEALGRHRDYLSQVLGRRVRLREELVLAVLDHLGSGPRSFYGELYRLDLPSTRGSAAAGGEGAEEPVATAAQRRALVDRERALLRRRIRIAELSQRQVSRLVGQAPDYLNQVLRGRVALKTAHVLAVLEVLETSPAAFYAELYGFAHAAEGGRRLTGGVSLGEVRDLIADALADLEDRDGEGVEPDDEESGEDNSGGRR